MGVQTFRISVGVCEIVQTALQIDPELVIGGNTCDDATELTSDRGAFRCRFDGEYVNVQQHDRRTQNRRG